MSGRINLDNMSEDFKSYMQDINSQIEYNSEIIESCINIESFPKLEDEVDDTNRIKRAVQYCTNLLLEGDVNSQKVIEFPSGKYFISDTIQLPIFVKIKSRGYVAFISRVSNGALFNMFSDIDISQNIGTPEQCRWGVFRGSWLNGTDGNITIVLDRSISKEGTVALNIGNTVAQGGWQNFSGWWNMNNVTIDGFDIGIKYNSYNNFLGKCDRFLITECNKAISFVRSDKVLNSGEGFTFSNSIFGDNLISVYIDRWNDLELNFTDCSFDFTGTVLKTSTVGFFKFTNCHFEGIGYTNQNVEIGGDESAIVYSTGGYWGAPSVFLSGCDFMSIRSELFKSDQPNGINLFIEGLTTKGSNGYTKLYALCDDNTNIVVNNFVPDKYLCLVPQRKLNNKLNPCFESIEDDTIINDNTNIDGYSFQNGFTGRTTISTKKMIDGKSIKMVIPNGGHWCQIISEKFDCKPGDKILNNFWWFVETDSTSKISRMSSQVTFYDRNNKVIAYPSHPMDPAATTSESENNKWCRLKFMEQVIAPAKATSFKIVYTINPTEACNLYLSEFYTLIY